MAKPKRKTIIIVVAVLLFILIVGSCGSSRGGSSKRQSGDTPSSSEAQQTEPDSSLPTVKTLWADFDVEIESLDENGIDFVFTNKDPRLAVMAFFNYVSADGKRYDVYDGNDLSGILHLVVDGNTATDMVEIPTDTAVHVHLSVDGVSDYSNIKIGFEQNTYDPAGGENYYYDGCEISVSSE